MKKIFQILIIFTIHNLSGQINFNVTTDFVFTSNQDFKEEKFTFSFNKNTNKMRVTDNDINFSKTYLVEFFKSSYSDDSNFYIMGYIGDTDKKPLDKEIPLFLVYRDKKLGKITHIEVHLYDTKAQKEIKVEDYYFTTYGKNYYIQAYE